MAAGAAVLLTCLQGSTGQQRRQTFHPRDPSPTIGPLWPKIIRPHLLQQFW